MRKIALCMALVASINLGVSVTYAKPKVTTTGSTSGNVIVNSPGTKIVNTTSAGGRTRTETTTYDKDGAPHTKVTSCTADGKCTTVK